MLFFTKLTWLICQKLGRFLASIKDRGTYSLLCKSCHEYEYFFSTKFVFPFLLSLCSVTPWSTWCRTTWSPGSPLKRPILTERELGLAKSFKMISLDTISNKTIRLSNFFSSLNVCVSHFIGGKIPFSLSWPIN